MTTLFISDLHLDPARPAVSELFKDFLAHRATQAEALYILGDLFEVWLGDDAILPDYEPLLDTLAKLRSSGTPVYVMHGNRDFLMGDAFAERAGCELLPDPTVIDLYGEPTLLMHGDTLCTDDVEYQRFRAEVRDPARQQAFLALSVAERTELAQYYREQSRQQTQHKDAAIMDVNQQAVAQAMARHGVQRLIHGHTHRPGDHTFQLDGLPARRIVLGDWFDQGSVLVCEPSGCQLEGLPLKADRLDGP